MSAPLQSVRKEPVSMAEEEKKETAPEVQDDFGVYKAWLRKTHLTEQLQGEIVRGIKAGESVQSLLLKCAKALSLATNNSVFYHEIEKELFSVYGEALGQPESMELELEGAKARLEKIKAARERADTEVVRDDMLQAIRAHEQRIAYLEKRLAGGE